MGAVIHFKTMKDSRATPRARPRPRPRRRARARLTHRARARVSPIAARVSTDRLTTRLDATRLDSQARTPRVKELAERVSGVPASTQRLLCRGRVLSDDASMESARVEDGDTLLLVKGAPETSGGRTRTRRWRTTRTRRRTPSEAEDEEGRSGTVERSGICRG